jgi:hypothetical protein
MVVGNPTPLVTRAKTQFRAITIGFRSARPLISTSQATWKTSNVEVIDGIGMTCRVQTERAVTFVANLVSRFFTTSQ